ncbi:MAG: pyridoxal 5'-phosphate synthase glutaminase subunit PdxT, partial [Chloroflexi bacterium]|nr:pyridoxal 5'-phosphate synthase glutaminase subunit PdxT [Chloroflexota bacterium]
KILNQGRNPMNPLKAIDITTERNAFGRQMDSFSQELDFQGIDNKIQAVFIRAPRIVQVAKTVDILCTLPDDTIVAAKQGKILVTSFHPELTADHSIHSYFCRMVEIT